MGTWAALNAAPRSRQAVQALTEAAPTLEADGIDLTSVTAIALAVHAPAGQTFDGTGSLLGYVWNGSMWMRASYFDRDMSYVSGLSDGSLPPLRIDSPRDRLMLVPNGVGVSGVGGNMTTEYRCTTKGAQYTGVPV